MPNALDDNIYDPVDLKLAAKMHKAITVIQMKLEGQLIAKHLEWEMSDRDIFGRTDFAKGTVTINGIEHELLDKSFDKLSKILIDTYKKIMKLDQGSSSNKIVDYTSYKENNKE